MVNCAGLQVFHSESVLVDCLCDNEPVDTFTGDTATHCMVHCGEKVQCLSFSFSKSDKLCWLHSTLLSETATGQHRLGAKCYNMKHDRCDHDDGYLYEPSVNGCHKPYSIFTDYNDARSRCLEDRGYLARLESFGEWYSTTQILAEGKYFIQGVYDETTSQWRFHDGTVIGMQMWKAPTKNILDNNTRLVLVESSNYIAVPSDVTLAKFICERHIASSLLAPTISIGLNIMTGSKPIAPSSRTTGHSTVTVNTITHASITLATASGQNTKEDKSYTGSGMGTTNTVTHTSSTLGTTTGQNVEEDESLTGSGMDTIQ
ncbi:uncharacterized protein [Argopecten irradians]|uniref:uncharacterized protein n=1 Tax=Argopecten irradians TaxID=31199 RepID=UPI0037145E6E